jgi:hypothetical protein
MRRRLCGHSFRRRMKKARPRYLSRRRYVAGVFTAIAVSVIATVSFPAEPVLAAELFRVVG